MTTTTKTTMTTMVTTMMTTTTTTTMKTTTTKMTTKMTTTTTKMTRHRWRYQSVDPFRSDASPGVKSTMNVTAPLGTNTEETLFNDISSAIVNYATTVKDWDVLQSNIKR